MLAWSLATVKRMICSESYSSPFSGGWDAFSYHQFLVLAAGFAVSEITL